VNSSPLVAVGVFGFGHNIKFLDFGMAFGRDNVHSLCYGKGVGGVYRIWVMDTRLSVWNWG
jgi:hypothetical protein